MSENLLPGGNGKINADDPFNMKALREPQRLVQVRQRRLVVPVRRKPSRLAFVRVHPDEEYRLPAVPIFREGKSESGGDEEMYYVHQSVLAEMDGEYRLYSIYTAVDLQANPFLWAVPLPQDDGREPNNWLVTNREAAELAVDRWLRVASDMGAGAYKIVEYEGAPIEPVFPKEPMLELMKLAFKHRIIDRPDHPKILRLRGLA
jgi:hypothetical protein